jgi:hypothetical protein
MKGWRDSVLAAIAAFSIGLVVPAASAGPWTYRTSADPMGRGKVITARLLSSNTITFGSPYGGPQRATLMLRSHPGWGKDLILSVERGQFLCRRDECRVLVRFDRGKAEHYDAVQPADHSTDTIFIRDYDYFVRLLLKAKRVRIEATFFREGNRIMEFDVSGLRIAGLEPVSEPPSGPTWPTELEVRFQRNLECTSWATNANLEYGPERDAYMKDCMEWRVGEPEARRTSEPSTPAVDPPAEKPVPLTPSMRVYACIREGEKRGHVTDQLTAFIAECTSGAHLDEAGQVKQ